MHFIQDIKQQTFQNKYVKLSYSSPTPEGFRHFGLLKVMESDEVRISQDTFKGWFPYDRRRSRIADRRSQKVLRSSAIIWKHTSAIVCDPAIVIADDRRR